MTIPLVGWAQQRIGGKRLWMIALTIFLLGSILCSLAWDAPSLIAFRVLQGVGGGLMLPLMSTLVMQAAHGQNLGRIMSVVSLPAVLGPILGPVVGGLILTTLDWRWLFWVNVPFCLVGLVLASRLLPKDGPGKPVRLDIVGLVLLSPAMVGILYGLSNVSKDGGFARADVLIPRDRRASRCSSPSRSGRSRKAGDALVDVRLFRHRPVASASALLFLSGASLYGAMLLLPLYFQEVRGADALGAGLLLVPQGVGTLFSRTLAGRLTDTLGARMVTIAGFAIVGLATRAVRVRDADHERVDADGGAARARLRSRRGHHPADDGRVRRTRRADVPHASILTRIAQQVGGSFGVAAARRHPADGRGRCAHARRHRGCVRHGVLVGGRVHRGRDRPVVPAARATRGRAGGATGGATGRWARGGGCECGWEGRAGGSV